MVDKKRDQSALWVIASCCLTTTLTALQITDAIGNLAAAALLFLNAVALGIYIVLAQQRKAKAQVTE